MPQASEELRAQFPGGDAEASKVLKAAGYVLTPDWEWRKPSPEHVPTPRESLAAAYLIDEWDYGGIIGEQP